MKPSRDIPQAPLPSLLCAGSEQGYHSLAVCGALGPVNTEAPSVLAAGQKSDGQKFKLSSELIEGMEDSCSPARNLPRLEMSEKFFFFFLPRVGGKGRVSKKKGLGKVSLCSHDCPRTCSVD